MTEPRDEVVLDPWGGQPRRRGPLVSFPLKVLWTAISVLVVFLAVGVALAKPWEVERTATIAAPPAAIFPWLDDPRRWDDWAPLGQVKSTFTGPERGAGATRRWDDPDVGDGTFTILSAIPDREVTYRVEVQKGRLVTEGTFRLEPDGSSTRVIWRERGDFGRNPLLGYVARNMAKVQGAQMEAALSQLALKVQRETEPK